jgi:hypothetical protein
VRLRHPLRPRGGKERTLQRESAWWFPRSGPHLGIGGEEEGHVLVEFRPALNTETFFETMYGLARDGKVDENGVPPL